MYGQNKLHGQLDISGYYQKIYVEYKHSRSYLKNNNHTIWSRKTGGRSKRGT